MPVMDRRQLLYALGGAGLLSFGPAFSTGWARGQRRAGDSTILEGSRFALTIDETPMTIAGGSARAITINGSVPGPMLRMREGDEVTIDVTNRLGKETSLHWHGILLPNAMDGVPGVTFDGIAPGETFQYRFPIRQAGTYWYHSHSGFQEQAGVYAPLIIDPAGESIPADREHILILSDWTFKKPSRLFSMLKKSSDAFNYNKRTIGDFFRDTKTEGLSATLSDRAAWGDMVMDPTDIADVTGATYHYLVNGYDAGQNWTGLFSAGERVKLRIINGSAMTIFNLRIPGLKMTVVEADGQPISPVDVDEFQIGVAETYDVIVEPGADRAYTIMAETIDRSGYARGTLAPRAGMAADVPPLRPAIMLSMADMGMAHGANGHMDMVTSGGDMHHEMPHMDHDAMPHMTAEATGGPQAQEHDHPRAVGVDMVAEQTRSRIDEPGLGLENEPHTVLRYSDLSSLRPLPDKRPPDREIELHLTGNMERYMWSFDGRKYNQAPEPIEVDEGDRLRFVFVNDTMMVHPIHIHGMWFELDGGKGAGPARKHTVMVKPAERIVLDATAELPGDWALHCHLLYHMAAGMFRVVRVRPKLAGVDR